MQYTNQYIEICLEGSYSIFKGLNQKDKESIAQHHTLSLVKKGAYLFKEGEKPRGLIWLSSGKVKVFREGVGGRDQILKMVRPKGLIGYRTLFSDYTWAFSSKAIEDSVICVIEKSTLVRIMKKNADFSLKLVRLIADELEFAYNRTISLSQKHIRARLSETLLILQDTYGFEEDGKTLSASLSREDIANLSNMTTSNAIRTLSNMSAEGIISTKGRKITILDYTNLQHISDLG
jgi:CRP/FNR family transcriptional regulator, polysaccharide utilization system transcription regulator